MAGENLPTSSDTEDTGRLHGDKAEQDKTVQLSRTTDECAETPMDTARRIATELRKRGVPEDEISRMVEIGVPVVTPLSQAVPAVSVVPLVEDKYVPNPTITLPAFRDTTVAEREEADRELALANLAKRRGRFAEAEAACRKAIELNPADAITLELYGDILQAVGRVDDALYAYHSATEVKPLRASAERKFAELRLLQNRDLDVLREELFRRNPLLSALLSLCIPGLGQIYNGNSERGFGLVVVSLICMTLLGWTSLGFPGSTQAISTSLVCLLFFTAGLYVYSVAEAYIRASSDNPKPKK